MVSVQIRKHSIMFYAKICFVVTQPYLQGRKATTMDNGNVMYSN